VVSGLAILLRWIVGKSKGEEEKSPLEILKERYAKGDIDKKEFDAIKKDIMKV
jgi:putative membrane protein